MRSILFVCMFCLLLGCGISVPVTFYGQNLDEYLDKPSNTNYLFPAAIQQRWQLVSINGDSTLLDMNLAEYNFFIYFQTTRSGKGRYQFGGKMTQGFWGEYSFNEKGVIEILAIRGMEKVRSGSAGSLEKLFERILVNAETYEITGMTMKLYSPTDVLEFTFPEPSIYR